MGSYSYYWGDCLKKGNSVFYSTVMNMEKEFISKLYNAHQNLEAIPPPSIVCKWLNGLLGLLFPELAEKKYGSLEDFNLAYQQSKLELNSILLPIANQLKCSVDHTSEAFLNQLPEVHAWLVKDAEAILQGDPAAISLTEVIRTYPGFLALAIHRVAHVLHELEVPLIPRILGEHAHGKTGVEIHPAAKIGQRFCIDHGTGIVIGETVSIGNNVKIYQGVTLGALSVKKEMARTKRHPTIEDNVIIYANATILGGDTVIGRDSIIGGNVWIIRSVSPGSRIYYQGEQQMDTVNSH